MARPRTTKNKDNSRRSKKRTSILIQEKVSYVDYKDVNLLRRFQSDRAKIRARRVTGNDTQQQADIAAAMRVADLAVIASDKGLVVKATKDAVSRGAQPLGWDAASPSPRTAWTPTPPAAWCSARASRCCWPRTWARTATPPWSTASR